MIPGHESGRRRGFTLLEVMIAVAFIGLALVAAMSAQSQGLKVSQEARHQSRAVFLARYILSVAQSTSNISPGFEDGAFDEPLDYLHWDREVTAVPGFQNLMRVRVWVRRVEDKPRTGVSLEGFTYGGS